LISIQGVLRDVTEQFRARQENQELRRDLAHVERVSVLGRLSSSLAHELSQPLGAILRNSEAAELLLQNPDPDLEELRQIVSDIQRDDRRAGEVIEGLRALLKRRELDFKELPAAGLVQSVLSLLRADASARNVALESRIDGDIPAIRGDRVHLSQVLINLIINAMDAVADLPAERRIVSVRVRAMEDGSIEFSVADSGAGIAEESLEKIFEPFFTTKSNGMGMGLSVSRTIIEAHQGRIWAQNGAGEGATMRFALPAFA
jgi:C4-dicarboxylate-specific signal transduction histidine kinase